MGTQQITGFEGEQRRRFMRALLADLRALEGMLADGAIEEGVQRIGAEQEMFLIDRTWHPTPAALRAIEAIGDPHFTTELGLFQLEMNLDAQPFSGDSLSRIERQCLELLGKALRAIAEHGTVMVLAGILPSLRKSDLGLENMVPLPRYQALNEAMTRMRGGEYEFFIKGLDELNVRHDSVMLEACNSSFQVHLQVGAKRFAAMYNLAQAIAGPTLACATNSPLLFGRRLWAETRIALFQQAVDTRRHVPERDRSPRVTFGREWVRSSVLELFKDNITRFRTLVGGEIEEDPFELLRRGVVPQLRALRLHNGTVYRWNRACYGITDNHPHLRIENRILPSGPTVLDEIANAALWLGLMSELGAQIEDVTQVMEFEHAQLNFVAAARQGLSATMVWLEGVEMPASQLILERLLPTAAAGLDRVGIRSEDRDRYLGVIEQRVRAGRTGSRWMLQSLAAMRDHGTPTERLNALTAAIVSRQTENVPVHEWDLAGLQEAGGWRHNYLRIEQYMSTDLQTVHADDPVELAANLMEWHRIRHVPVEDQEHRLIGLVTYRQVLRLMAQGGLNRDGEPLSVAEVMKTDPIIVSPGMPTTRAIEIMRQFGVGCLPVVQDDRLVGIVTESDFMQIAGQLLEDRLKS
jgi:CBS domain-containing protein